MRGEGVRKVKDADLVESARTRTRARALFLPENETPNLVEEQPPMNEDVFESGDDMVDHPAPPSPHNDEPTRGRADGSFEDHADSADFWREVDTHGDHLEVDWEGADLHDVSGDHVMSSLMDTLQLVGGSLRSKCHQVMSCEDQVIFLSNVQSSLLIL